MKHWKQVVRNSLIWFTGKSNSEGFTVKRGEYEVAKGIFQ